MACHANQMPSPTQVSETKFAKWGPNRGPASSHFTMLFLSDIQSKYGNCMPVISQKTKVFDEKTEKCHEKLLAAGQCQLVPKNYRLSPHRVALAFEERWTPHPYNLGVTQTRLHLHWKNLLSLGAYSKQKKHKICRWVPIRQSFSSSFNSFSIILNTLFSIKFHNFDLNHHDQKLRLFKLFHYQSISFHR